jgi:acetyl-CoA C-acetyltransferase
MTSQRSVIFAEPVRTAIGTFGGSLKDVPAPTLGAVAIGAAVARADIRPDEVETVVMGNVVQAGTKMNPARQAAVHAGLPVSVPALTVNRVCGSGAQAIVSATPMSQSRAAWRTWIRRRTSLHARAGVIAWAMASFTTACCVTD